MATTAPPAARRRARPQALVLLAVLVLAMWAVEAVDQVASGRLDQYGIEPRETDGLVGIGTAPFLHGGLGHLVANTLPFIALGAVIALSGLARMLAVTLIVAVVAGVGTWLTAPAGTEHIGASGIVFGYAAYLIARGVFSRDLLHLGVGLIVIAVYGSTLTLGLMPAEGISWQGHFFGGVGGVVAAWALHRRGRAGAAATGAPSTAR